MTDPDKSDRIAELEKRIEAAKAAQAPKPRADEHYSMANMAWRMVIELVAGLGIGFGIGFGLDTLFGTTPFLLVIFTLLGLAAGIQTMLRTAKEVQGDNTAGEADKDDEGS